MGLKSVIDLLRKRPPERTSQQRDTSPGIIRKNLRQGQNFKCRFTGGVIEVPVDGTGEKYSISSQPMGIAVSNTRNGRIAMLRDNFAQNQGLVVRRSVDYANNVFLTISAVSDLALQYNHVSEEVENGSSLFLRDSREQLYEITRDSNIFRISRFDERNQISETQELTVNKDNNYSNIFSGLKMNIRDYGRVSIMEENPVGNDASAYQIMPLNITYAPTIIIKGQEIEGELERQLHPSGRLLIEQGPFTFEMRRDEGGMWRGYDAEGNTIAEMLNNILVLGNVRIEQDVIRENVFRLTRVTIETLHADHLGVSPRSLDPNDEIAVVTERGSYRVRRDFIDGSRYELSNGQESVYIDNQTPTAELDNLMILRTEVDGRNGFELVLNPLTSQESEANILPKSQAG